MSLANCTVLVVGDDEWKMDLDWVQSNNWLNLCTFKLLVFKSNWKPFTVGPQSRLFSSLHKVILKSEIKCSVQSYHVIYSNKSAFYETFCLPFVCIASPKGHCLPTSTRPAICNACEADGISCSLAAYIQSESHRNESGTAPIALHWRK